MKRFAMILFSIALALSACAEVDVNAPMPAMDSGADPEAWATVPAGAFLLGQAEEEATVEQAYQIMVNDVTVAQYVDYLNNALEKDDIQVTATGINGAYPGDTYNGYKHEIRIDPGQYLLVPLNEAAAPFTFDGETFAAKAGWENHPMTYVTWFGARAYCKFHNDRLPSALEWEKAARGAADARPFPWGETISRNNANYYKSGDPFEEMSTVGSRTSPVGFYNGRTYNGYATINSASPYGVYDMAGNVWQWVGDIIPGFSDRYLRGGSSQTYDMDLRIWVRNSAPPMYYAGDAGFRCVRDAQP